MSLIILIRRVSLRGVNKKLEAKASPFIKRFRAYHYLFFNRNGEINRPVSSTFHYLLSRCIHRMAMNRYRFEEVKPGSLEFGFKSGMTADEIDRSC